MTEETIRGAAAEAKTEAWLRAVPVESRKMWNELRAGLPDAVLVWDNGSPELHLPAVPPVKIMLLGYGLPRNLTVLVSFGFYSVRRKNVRTAIRMARWYAAGRPPEAIS